jgi:acetyltransferase-like isoleucine patch superfamily enzyme
MTGRLYRLLFGKAPSRRLQAIAFRLSRLRTLCWHAPRMVACGKGSIVGRPLFWTPEHVAAGDDVLIWPGCRIEGIPPAESGSGQEPLVVLGHGVAMQQSCHITAAGRLSIGAGTLMSFNVSVQDTDHRYDDITCSVSKQPLTFAPTTIGENCFLGAGSRILAGTTLGRHCVVGANAVVRGEFPDFSVIAGNPARVIRRYDAAEGQWTKASNPSPAARP